MSTVYGDSMANYTTDRARVRYRLIENTDAPVPDLLFELAGPREHIYWNPAQTRAAIVTCGGLCPGLNNVIRSVFLELHHRYGVPEVLGLRFGYQGLNPACGHEPMKLSEDIVDRIHEHGGTILGTSRGPQPPEVMVDFLQHNRINILFCVGGDGTLRGAKSISDAAAARGFPVSVIGIPKTIDNDVMYVQRTFGVMTAVEQARRVLESAHMEARSAYNGVGLVKLMGRHAGFVTCGATVSSGEVNIALIPEVPFALEGENGLFAYLRKRLEKRHHAVIVVAEGAGQDLMAQTEGTDRSGNRKMSDIGLFLRDGMREYANRAGMPIDVKYFDPSYYIRSGAPISEDAILCDQLARSAVHAAMAGRTAMIVSMWHSAYMHVPIDMATSASKQVDLEGPLWAACLSATGQPETFR
jgi:6-phosphofructokinase 1